MNDIDVVTLLLSPILGAVAAYYIPIFIKGLSFTDRKSFTGEWHSTWQTNSESDKQWSIDKVTISFSRGGVFLKNRDNNNGYVWEARGNVNKNRFISGTWHSIKPGSTSAGDFVLSVSNQGDFILGFFVGPNRNDFLNYGAWILTREKKELERGKLEIAKMCPGLVEVMSLIEPTHK